jgi:hypothetical protein
MYFIFLENIEHAKPIITRYKEIIKIMTEINEMETQKLYKGQ